MDKYKLEEYIKTIESSLSHVYEGEEDIIDSMAESVEKETKKSRLSSIKEEGIRFLDQLKKLGEDKSTEEEFSKDENKDHPVQKYYLANSDITPNFAYVPEKILVKLKQKDNKANNYYKKDDLQTKGILVRSDQFMKLSLSKKRQEGILREAKEYRIKLATKSREQLEEI